MPRPFLPLLGAGLTVLLVAAAGTAWLALRSPMADAAAEAPPARAESAPRLSDAPQYERCLDLVRQDADEAFRFATAWEATGGGEGARHCAALALLGLSEADRAAERLETLAARSAAPAATRAGLFAQAGDAWIMAGQPNRAFAAATMGLTLAPQDAELLVDRAIALGTMGRNAEALEDLDRAVAVEPRRAEAWVLRAAALRRLDRGSEAERAVETALAIAADNVEALLERGILRQLRGQTAAARADWQKVVTLAPDSPAADLALQNLALSDAGPPRR